MGNKKDKQKLQEEVVHRLKENGELRGQCCFSQITWHAPVVRIQDILLNEKPCELERTLTGARPIPSKKYLKKVALWEKNRIGGTAKLAGDCKSKTWFPPPNSKLFRLQRIEQEWGYRDVFEYFLLFSEKDTPIFLKRRSGGEASLSVITFRDRDIFFQLALENVLKWKSG